MMNLINTPHFLSRTEKARSWLDSEGHTEISSGYVEMEFRGRYVHGGAHLKIQTIKGFLSFIDDQHGKPPAEETSKWVDVSSHSADVSPFFSSHVWFFSNSLINKVMMW